MLQGKCREAQDNFISRLVSAGRLGDEGAMNVQLRQRLQVMNAARNMGSLAGRTVSKSSNCGAEGEQQGSPSDQLHQSSRRSRVLCVGNNFSVRQKLKYYNNQPLSDHISDKVS